MLDVQAVNTNLRKTFMINVVILGEHCIIGKTIMMYAIDLVGEHCTALVQLGQVDIRYVDVTHTLEQREPCTRCSKADMCNCLLTSSCLCPSCAMSSRTTDGL